ncbi:MAG: ribosome assembly RNA-binding protein YhbY [Nitrospiraceae bacterium]|nr:ribosome assembly RNA-binding protein YhbY [Nitrospiraceae bacterium]
MEELTSAQRKQLRSLAHHLKPVCYIGKSGLTESLKVSVDVALEAHELVKVKYVGCKDQKKELTAQLAEQTQSQLAGIIGHVAILYRQQRDPEKRNIELREP